MKKLAISSLTAMSAVLGSWDVMAVEASPVRVGIFDVAPTFAVGETYDDNIFSQPDGNETESWVTVVSPALQASADLGAVDVLLEYEHSSGFYSNSSDDNYSDNSFSATAEWELNQRNQLNFGADYVAGHDARGTGFTKGAAALSVAEPDKYHEVIVDAQYILGSDQSKGRLITDLANYDKTYTNNRATTLTQDRNELRASSAFYWRMGGRTDLLVEADYADVNYDNDPVAVSGFGDTLDSANTSYYAGVSWEATAKTTGIIKLGQTKKDFEDPDRGNATQSSWQVDVEWAPKSYSVVSLTAAREARETTGVGDFVDAKIYALDWSHDWTNVFTTIVFFNFDDESYEGVTTPRSDETKSYGIRMDYELRRWLDLGLSFTETKRDSTVDTNDFDRRQVALSVLMSL